MRPSRTPLLLNLARFYLGRSKDGLKLLSQVSKRLVPKYRFKWPQMDWWDAPWFNDFLAENGELNSFDTDRRWMMRQLARLVTHLDGDTAEFGVYRGVSSALILMATGGDNCTNRHHLFDSFEGLSVPESIDGTHWKAGDLACSQSQVAERLEAYSERLVFHKGWIPQTFTLPDSVQFRFAHIDVDLYQPTLDSLAFCYSRMVPGGVIVCDDYGFNTCPGATTACNEFLADKPEKMLALCSGAGFLIKGVPTSEQGAISAYGNPPWPKS